MVEAEVQRRPGLAEREAEEAARRIGAQLRCAFEAKEEELDGEIERLENLKEDDLETLRERRRRQLIEASKTTNSWKLLGHGEYKEIHSDMDFFQATKNSPKVIAHFYLPSSNVERVAILDKHLEVLASKHVDIRFAKINVEKCPFVVSRLRVRVLPSMLIIVEQQIKRLMIGFEEMGGRDDFSTADLEAALGRYKCFAPFSPNWHETHQEMDKELVGFDSDEE